MPLRPAIQPAMFIAIMRRIINGETAFSVGLAYRSSRAED